MPTLLSISPLLGASLSPLKAPVFGRNSATTQHRSYGELNSEAMASACVPLHSSPHLLFLDSTSPLWPPLEMRWNIPAPLASWCQRVAGHPAAGATKSLPHPPEDFK